MPSVRAIFFPQFGSPLAYFFATRKEVSNFLLHAQLHLDLSQLPPRSRAMRANAPDYYRLAAPVWEPSRSQPAQLSFELASRAALLPDHRAARVVRCELRQVTALPLLV